MGKVSRLLQWTVKHPVVSDSLLVIFCVALWILTNANTTILSPGFLYDPSPTVMMAWNILLTLPVAIRRWRPKLSANCFLVVAALQILFGPLLNFADVFALPILYNVIVRTPSKTSRKYIVTALIYCIFAALMASFMQTYGPIAGLNAASAQVMATPQCGAENFASGLCARMLATNFFAMCTGYLVCVGMAIAFGFWSRARHQTAQIIEERNQAILARRAEEEHIAALAERARIARDMHDVVAHTLSIIIVQSDGGRYAAANNPELALETMGNIKHESEHALHDMNRLLSVFGGSTHADYFDIEALVKQAAGISKDMHISRSIHGKPQPDELSTTASEAVYHVVQEALTNIRKYAGHDVHVQVTESWDQHGFSIEITDDGRGASASLDGHKAGTGLLGMRERVENAGGTLQTGPGISGGYRVYAEVPFHFQEKERAQSQSSKKEQGWHMPTFRDARTTSASADLHGEEVRGKRKSQGNLIERLSRWTQDNPVITDGLGALLTSLVLCLSDGFVMYFPIASNFTDHYLFQNRAFTAVLALLCLLPLAVRRVKPQLCAIVVAVVCALQLVFVPYIYIFDVIAVFFAVYSVFLYGKKSDQRWVYAVIVAELAVFACKLVANNLGYLSIAGMLANGPRAAQTSNDWALDVAVLVPLSAMVCVSAMVFAAWQRVRGANVLVLKAQQAALREEQEKQRVLAANMERDRISTAIQQEVTDTLNSVIGEAADGIAMIKGAQTSGNTVEPEDVGAAFGAIGKQGRVALAHMRELLGVLRETGFSDNTEMDLMKLRPNTSVEEQMEQVQGSASTVLS